MLMIHGLRVIYVPDVWMTDDVGLRRESSEFLRVCSKSTENGQKKEEGKRCKVVGGGGCVCGRIYKMKRRGFSLSLKDSAIKN